MDTAVSRGMGPADEARIAGTPCEPFQGLRSDLLVRTGASHTLVIPMPSSKDPVP